MLRYVAPLILVLTSANSWKDEFPRQKSLRPDGQVASPSQVKFALENKFDDTGPGAKQPEFVYNTYKNLEDALVAYLNDPDTKLPEHEKEKAVNKLLQQEKYAHRAPTSLFLKDERFKLLQKPFNTHITAKPTSQSQNFHTQVYNLPIGKHFYDQDAKIGKIAASDVNEVPKVYQIDTKLGPFKFQKIHKGIPLSISHYTRDYDLKVAQKQLDIQPKYSYSYGVQDKTTGDSKSVQESRDGSNVRGYYSFLDSDGKRRTVYYTVDDRQGFLANVQKT